MARKAQFNETTNDPHLCPACGRKFKSIFSYPRVRIVSFERLPIPEAVDYLSDAAAEKLLARRRQEPSDSGTGRQEGINITPAIERACNTNEVQQYLALLESLTGQEIAPKQLPHLKAHGYFKKAYPIADTRIFLTLEESEHPLAGRRTAEVQLYCEGPNLGSAGGPTLQFVGAIARLCYQGLLAEGYCV